MRLTLLVLCLIAAGCTFDDDGGGQPDVCTRDQDCPGTQFCLLGVCTSGASCVSDAECPEGYKCLANGACKKGIVCEVDQECPAGMLCVDYDCVGTNCSPDGATMTCVVGCHEGKKTCSSGNWSDCDAAPVLEAEACETPWDDDCDGEINEDCVQCEPGDSPLPCSTPCGDGVQTCDNGVWGECSAPSDCVCAEPGVIEEASCGNCGTRTRTCGDSEIPFIYRWGEFGPCLGEGLCPAGDEEEVACGFHCGIQLRMCQAECAWSEWSDCLESGVCSPEETDTMECGNCGEQSKTCGSDCFWLPWGDCIEDAGCQLGDLETKPCGNCGTQTHYCETDCHWGDWGDCQGGGVCAPGEKDSEACGYCGSKERSCLNTCQWGAFGSCQAGGDCVPGDVLKQACGPDSDKGICEKGQQQKTCNSACQWNAWGSCLGAVYPKSEICGDGIDQDCDGKDKEQPDQYEPNDSCNTCTWISGIDPEVTYYATFDSKGGQAGGSDTDDYFCFKSEDNFNIWPTAEHLKVELNNQPVGIDGDLFLYKGLSDCQANSPVASAVTIGGANEAIDWQETGDDDTATYYVRVQNWSDQGNCYQTYTLKIQGLK